jgi:RHS repeat-associated protein
MQSKVDSINSRNQKGLVAKFIRGFNVLFCTNRKWVMGCLPQNSLTLNSRVLKFNCFLKGFLLLIICWFSTLAPQYAVAQTSRDICIQQNPRGMFDCSDSPAVVTDWSWSLSTFYDGPKTTYLSPVASEQGLIAGFMRAISEGQSALIPNFCGISIKSMGTLKEGRAYFERGTMLIYLSRDVTFNLCYSSVNSNGVTETSYGLATINTQGRREGKCTAPKFFLGMTNEGHFFCYGYTKSETPNICSIKNISSSDGVSAGNPISPATGEKLLTEPDYIDNGASPLSITRLYKSGVDSGITAYLSLGKSWQIMEIARLERPNDDSEVQVTTVIGERLRFFRPMQTSNPWRGIPSNCVDCPPPSTPIPEPPVWRSITSSHKFEKIATGYRFTHADNDYVYTFDTDNRILSVSTRNNWLITYTYFATGQLSQIINQFGRSLLLAYNASGQINQITQPDGRVVRYDYATGTDNIARLSRVTYPDNTFKTYLYENPSFPNALTGVTDENNTRLATYTYDAQGRAIDTQHAGGANRYQVAYTGTGTVNSAQVTDPLGTARSYTYGTNLGQLAVTGANQPSGQGLRDAASRVQNASGLVDSEVDFLGFTNQTTWDTARRLKTAETRAAGRPEAQTTTTQWHPTLRLPVLVTEQGRTTAMTYDALGNKLTETLTDTSVNPQISRTTAYTYNPAGLVATETAPNNAVTSTTYNAAGNPVSSTNALGHVTTMAYAGADGAAGRVTSMTAPTGLATSYTYDARGRLLSTTQAAGTSTLASLYTYTPSGQLASAALPSGHQISYQYDAAQRLVGWQDNRGARGAYTLDAMGNRTTEQIKNAAGQVVWQLARSINAINRVASETVGAAAGTVNNNLQQSYSYNANGSLVSEANGLQQTTQYGLDGLRRVTAITNAASATANLAYNALDAVTSAKDFKGATTATARDALGNALTTSSNDAGNQTAQYDALGLPKQTIDALGQATSITRDALGRPTLITQADGRSTQLRYDLAGTAYNAAGSPAASKGYLSEIADTTDKTTYLRDGFGRIVKKTQQLAPFTGTTANPAGAVKSVQYSYAASSTGSGPGVGQMASLTYPNGTLVSYVYSAAGQISQINWGSATASNPLVTDITYTPLGQPSSWNWQFADTSATTVLPATRVYDTAGRVIATELGTYTYDSAGRITSLTQILAKPSNTTSTSTAITTATAVYTIGYDNLGRISTFNRAAGSGLASTAPLPAQSASFTYDANGNRLSSIQTTGSGAAANTVKRTYTVDPTSNRILNFTQTQLAGTATTGATSAVNYSYDANGAMTKDGLRSYEFDAANRLADVTTGVGIDAPTTRYVHNALGQRLFKTEPLFAPVSSGSNPADPGVMQTLANFFASLWGGNTTTAAPSASEKLGFTYYYDEDGSLLYEVGSGGANSTGSAHYVYLPTPAGPMPIATYTGNKHYAVQTDHLNTPRRLTNSSKQVAWQWAFSAFGDEQPTLARNRFVDPSTTPNAGTTTVAEVTFNLRYPGQYFDKESNLHYNWMRSYSPNNGRYTQADPIGLQGGWNKFSYVDSNPLSHTDPKGLVKWSGEMYSVIGIAGAGGGQFWFDLKSECVNGKYAYIRLYASALGVGLGAKFTGGASPISFDDYLSDINPEAFQGGFTMASGGIGAILTGGYSAVRLGRNTADFSATPSPAIGFDLSIAGLRGRATLASKEIKSCNCP